jgi:hypothetical protein
MSENFEVKGLSTTPWPPPRRGKLGAICGDTPNPGSISMLHLLFKIMKLIFIFGTGQCEFKDFNSIFSVPLLLL